ncbi:nucleotidyltransferase domain-containing protein [Candidatus Gottesmanbacteria bacterium]|nr:nucleotidyltransferase domain-containing protein [Candidatus Gottesmanbacteria bacterium]
MIDNNLKQNISQSLAQNASVIAAYALGSFTKGTSGSESDFDLAVVVDKSQPDSLDSMYELLKDIQFPKNLDLSVVDTSSSPLFLYQVINKGERVYERNRRDMIQFETYVLHNYYDTAHLRAMYARHLKEKFSEITYAN